MLEPSPKFLYKIGLKLAVAITTLQCLGACGFNKSNPADQTEPDLIQISGFSVTGSNNTIGTVATPALIELNEGAKFKLNWSTSSQVAAIGTIHLSKTEDFNDDKQSDAILTKTCDSKLGGACDWNGEAVCAILPNNSLSCLYQGDKKPSTETSISRFKGSPESSVYFVLEACAAFTCKTESRKVILR